MVGEETAAWFSGSGLHVHSAWVENHYHEGTLQNNSHNHTVEFPNHNHTINIPTHTHETEYGIYQGLTANSVVIKVDGQTIPTTQPGDDIDIVNYLSVDSNGKVQRNIWHDIEITPDTMTRITANVFFTDIYPKQRRR